MPGIEKSLALDENKKGEFFHIYFFKFSKKTKKQ